MKDECRAVYDSELLELLVALKNEHIKRIQEQINHNGISEHSMKKCETCAVLLKYDWLDKKIKAAQ